MLAQAVSQTFRHIYIGVKLGPTDQPTDIIKQNIS